MAKRSAASSGSATSSLAFARSRGRTANSCTLPEGLTRWRPRSRKTRPSFPTSGRASKRIGTALSWVSHPAADRLLGGEHGLIGRPLGTVQPSIGSIWEQARSLRLRLHQGQATVLRDGRERVLNVRVTGNPGRDGRASVITLDDISDLVTAQRTAAWADVARRIAHEIRNPLTPIQLSAERLKRRYGKHIVEGREIFDQC